MKRFLILIAIFVTTNLFAQQDKIYTSLDEALKNPTQVYHLNLSGQGLTKVPKGFKEMVNLKTIDLSNNKLSDLPSFSPFDYLESVNLSNNNFTYTPSFIELKTGDRNLIAENNPFTNFIPSTEKEIDLVQSGFEGTIRMSSKFAIQLGSDKENGKIVGILYEGQESEHWINLQQRNGKSDEVIIEEIKKNTVFEFNYSVNAHITMKSKSDIPQFYVYAYTDKSDNVGITSMNFVVFFSEYYITGASTKKSISYYTLKRGLAVALTYNPEDDGASVRIDKIAYTLISPALLLGKCENLNAAPVNKIFPELPVTREIIHTLSSGETVAFTNEYQLGIDLKDDQYYIYLKKGGKYYVKTAKTLLGPYENLPNASPEQRGPIDFVNEFKAIKNGKAYFISAGKEYGPFPLETMASYDDEENTVSFFYEKSDKQFITINSIEYGPFKDVYYPKYYKGQPVFLEYDYHIDTMTISMGKEKLLDHVKAKSDYLILWDHLMFKYEVGSTEFIRVDEQTFGPYLLIKSMGSTNGKAWFNYLNEDKYWVNFDNTVYGPFSDLFDFNNRMLRGYFVALSGTDRYVYVGHKKYGPFPSTDKGDIQVILNEDQTAVTIIYENNAQKFVVHNGIQYGPFLEASSLDFYSQANQMRSSDILPIVRVRDLKNEYYCFVNDQKFGPFKNSPRTVFSEDSDKVMFIISEKNKQGGKEKFILSGNEKTGPFKTACHGCARYNDTLAFCNFPIAAESFDNQFFLIAEEGTFGPFDTLVIVSEYGEESDYLCRQNDQWYYFTDNVFNGPFEISNLQQFAYFEGNTSEDFYGEEEGPMIINGKKFTSSYSFLAANGNNYVAIESWSGLKFVINNKEYKDANILTYDYHWETKKFYWLTLEGKSIVRNSVQL